jgi:nitrite reductase/ring-hydroxylating ferredoxin subunit
MSEFKKALSNSELEEGSILAVRVNGERIALYKINGEIYATSENARTATAHSKISARSSKAIKSNASVTAQGSSSKPAK